MATDSVSWLNTYAEDSVECEASENLWWESLFKKRDLWSISLITSSLISCSVDCSYIEQIGSTVSEYTTLENVSCCELLCFNSTGWDMQETVSLFNFYKMLLLIHFICYVFF